MFSILALRLFYAFGKSEITCNAHCNLYMIGDNYCDEICMSKECNYDSPLYSDSKYLSFMSSDCFFSCPCNEEQLTNGICDSECNKVECAFDLGDCGYCAPGCFLEDLESDICKDECFVSGCYHYEFNQCFFGLCAPKCYINYLGDGNCHRMCLNPECKYDLGDCDCSYGCFDTNGECLTNGTFTDPCDTILCNFKNGKCGFCDSGCFEKDLGDGICQMQCNNYNCYYDYGDCGCSAGCSFMYDVSISNFKQTGLSSECSANCLVLNCHFGVDFCSNITLIKIAVMNFLLNKEAIGQLIPELDACEYLGCDSTEINSFLDGTIKCTENNVCYHLNCFYCMGQANKTFENCLRQTFTECLLCDSSLIEGSCYEDLYDCPHGYQDKSKLSDMFGINHWCLKEAVHYSKSYYKEVYVDSSVFENRYIVMQGVVKSLYFALLNVYAAYTKIYLLNKEIYFFIDDSTSILVNDVYDPLKISTIYPIYELWIIGNYSETEKTIIYWKDNLKLSPQSKKFFLINLELIGKYTMNNNCREETCFYCPNIIMRMRLMHNDKYERIDYFTYKFNYSKYCNEYTSVNVFNFPNEAFIENVSFSDFRYQFNSFIKSSGGLSLNNVNFTKMQAKSTGSIILLESSDDSADVSFTYNQGFVVDLGAGYNDVENVETGSFLKSSGFGHISISNVIFSYNFVFHNLRSTNNGYLIYSKNHLGTINIEDCVFSHNYANYLVFIDVSSLNYNFYRIEKGTSINYSQRHFYMNNIQIRNTYSSHGMIKYLMKGTVHNIKVTNLLIEESVNGDDGILVFINEGKLKNSDINGDFYKDYTFGDSFYIYIEPRYLHLEDVIIKNSKIGKNAINIENLPNSILKKISIFGILDGSEKDIQIIIDSFKKNDENRYFSYIDIENELPLLNCNEMILVVNCVNLEIDSLLISEINCGVEEKTLGLFLKNITGKANINDLSIETIKNGAESGIALRVLDSFLVNITDLSILNVTNLNESVISFEKCNKITVNTIKLEKLRSNYTSVFTVVNSKSFTLLNFLFNNIQSEYSNGGCLSLLTGIFKSSFEIKSGNFNKCISKNAKGGAVFLDSLTRVISTSFQMYDIYVGNSSSYEGSAIFISNSVIFSKEKESELSRLVIKDNDSKGGGSISDYHFSGTLKINELYLENSSRGIYVFYSNNYSQLHILNTKIYAPDSLVSLIYLNSLVLGSSAYFFNVEIFTAKQIAIEANNFIVFIDQMNITDTFQALYLNDQVNCQANKLKIANNFDKSVIVSKKSAFFCNNCEFYNSKNSIIEASSQSYFTLIDSKIFSNILSSQYILSIFSGGAEKESFLVNCQIYSNSIFSGSLIYLLSSSLTIKNCSIIENNGYTDTAQAIYLYNSKLDLKNSTLQFNGLVEFGTFFYALAESKVTAIDTIFKNSESRIGNIYGSNANILISNCTFSHNAGGDIYTFKSNLEISNTIFEYSTLTRSNLGIIALVSNYKTIIEKSIIKRISNIPILNSLSYIYDELSKQLSIINCTMIGSNNFIMAINVKETVSVLIENSSLINFNTREHSALTAISNINNCDLTIINSLITQSTSANNGGGVFIESYNILIESSEISSNSAHNSGGGIYFSSTNCDDCGIHLLGNTKIFNNSCKGGGGAIKWKDYKPYIESTVSIFNNSATYGLDLASIPAKFGLFQGRIFSDSIMIVLSNVPPGKKITDSIQVNIYDTYEQIVKTESSITASLVVNETIDSVVAISGITSFKAHNGILNLENFILTGQPGSSAYIKLKSDDMKSNKARNDNNIYSDSVYIKVGFRNCTKGEQIQAIGCVDCIAGKYALEASENCLDCPTGAACTGGSTIIVKNGFWRSSLESDVIYPCDVFDACLKGNETNELGSCGSGYSGVLCKSCEIGYSKKSNGICTKCPDKITNFITTVLLFLSIHFISYIMVKTTLTSAFSPKSLHSIYIKIFTNYLQLVFIVTQFDLEWPAYIIEFFNVQRVTASVSDQLFSLDCIIALRHTGDIKNVYYTKLCIITALPIIITTISYLYWIFHGSIVDSYKYLKREVYTTIIVLFFLVYPTIVKFIFSNFSCVEIDMMKSYLNENTSIECWSFNHKKLSFIVALPSILLWAIGVPTILLILMTKNRKRLHSDYYRVVYGFLYNGYKQSRYYWEINIMYRKIILITITVFKSSQVHVLQALNFVLLLLASIYLHHSYKPYISSHLNNMEKQALNIAAITIYFGIYYLTKNINEPIKIILFIFIVLGNSYFILYWLYYITCALVDIFIRFFPRFRSILKKGDAFSEEFYLEEIFRKGVYFNPLEGKRNYTFLNNKRIVEVKELEYCSIDDIYIAIAKRDIDRQIKFQD